MYNEDYLKVKKAFQDKEFVEKLLKFNDQTEPEEVQALFAEKGIELTIEEINEIHDQVVGYNEGELTEEEQKLRSIVQKDFDGEELSDEELELVSGGMSGYQIFKLVGSCIGLALSIAGIAVILW